MSFVQSLNGFVDSMPKQLPVKIGQSFIASVALGGFFGATAKVAILAGSIAATATLVEAVARPIIDSVFPENQGIALASTVLISITSAFGLANAASSVTGLTYRVSAPLFSLIGMLCLNQDPRENNLAMAFVL